MVPKWNEMVSKEITRLHFVVFIIPVDRLSKSLLEEVGLMTNFLIKWDMKAENVVVVLNKCDFFSDELIEGYINGLKSVVDLPPIIRDAPILRSCFLNPRVVVPAIQAAAEEKMVASTNQLADLLLNPANVNPFYPRQAIPTQETLDAERRRQQAIAEAERIRQQQVQAAQRNCIVC